MQYLDLFGRQVRLLSALAVQPLEVLNWMHCWLLAPLLLHLLWRSLNFSALEVSHLGSPMRLCQLDKLTCDFPSKVATPMLPLASD